MDFVDVLTMPWGYSTYSNSHRGGLVREINIELAPWIELEEDAWGGLLAPLQ